MGNELRPQTARIRIVADLEHLSHEAAQELLERAQRRVRAAGRFSLVLAGGSTPRMLYGLLAGGELRDRLPWKSIHVFWGDERCVNPNHAQSNFRMAHETLLSQVPISAEHIHRIAVDEGDPPSVAARYERELKAFFRSQDQAAAVFDLVILGLGTDGHTVSLFPRSAALKENRLLVVATKGGNPCLPRITLTVPVLNQAKQLMWLVAGKEKAPMVQIVLEDSRRANDVPACMIRPIHGTSLWLIDRAAAVLLRKDWDK